jgi:hypothetical protein
LDTMSPGTHSKLVQSTRMLLEEFGSFPETEVVLEIERVAQSLLKPARFDDYIPILAYRVARDHLRERIADQALVDAA